MYKLFTGDIPSDLQLTGDIAIDTETLGLNLKRDRLCLVQIADSVGQIILVKFTENIYNAPNLVALISDPSRTKIFHYGRFDITALMYYLQIPKIAPVFCTKISSKLTRTYTDFHGLKTICKELLLVELDKEMGTSNWAAPVLSEKQIKYAINDVLYLHRLRDILTSNLKSLNREDIAKGCFEFLHTIANLEISGFDTSSLLSH
jgi:ribonuclease D